MLVAKNQEIDLGTLKYGVPKTLTFELKNEGNHDIQIDQLVLGCHACTTASVSDSVVKPRQTTYINATYTPGSTGISNKSIVVVYGTTQLKLKFKAFVTN